MDRAEALRELNRATWDALHEEALWMDAQVDRRRRAEAADRKAAEIRERLMADPDKRRLMEKYDLGGL